MNRRRLRRDVRDAFAVRACALAQDVVTFGSLTTSSTTVDIPVPSATSGTPLGIDKATGSRIQAFSIRVDYAPAAAAPSPSPAPASPPASHRRSKPFAGAFRFVRPFRIRWCRGAEAPTACPGDSPTPDAAIAGGNRRKIIWRRRVATATVRRAIELQSSGRRATKMNKSEMETPAYVCSHIFDATRAVLLVTREDGDWQFLCGGSHDADEKPRVVGLNHLVARDETLREVLDLPSDWDAERSEVNAPWARTATLTKR